MPRPHFAIVHRNLYTVNVAATALRTQADSAKPTRIKTVLAVTHSALFAGVMGTRIGTGVAGLYGLLVSLVYGALHGLLSQVFVWTAWWALAGALTGAITGTMGRLFEGTPLSGNPDSTAAACRNGLGG